MPHKQKRESLDAMMADDLDSYSKSLQTMGVEEGYSLFPKSDYQQDDKSTLHGNLDHLSRILSNRTLRILARHGISGDKTGMGSNSRGFVLIDEDDLEYIADIVEPSKEQIQRFLHAERRRILNDTGLQQGDGHPKEETEEVAQDEEKLEEEDYRRAMKILRQLRASPGVIASCFVVTGTSSSVFYSPNLEKRDASITLFRRVLAKAIGLSTAEISVGKIQDTTSGVLTECCDIEITICTLDTADANNICQKIRELMATDDLGNMLVKKGISVLCKLRRGPHVFVYGQGYDLIQRAIGEPAADLMQSMARWEWQLSKNRLKREKILREREAERARREAAERAAERRKWSDEALDAAMEEKPDQSGTPDAATAQTEVNVSAEPEISSKVTTPVTTLPTPSEPPGLEPLASVHGDQHQLVPPFHRAGSATLSPTDTAKPLKPLKKKFKVGQGDTLEMSKTRSFLTEFDQEYEPHGFKLQDPALRPATAMNVRMQEYAKEQATHVFDTTRRASSVPPLAPVWTPKKYQHAGSSYTLALRARDLPSSGIAQQDTQADQHHTRLQEYFRASLRNKRCPQKGKMSEEARHELAVRKQAQLQHLHEQREKERQRQKELKQKIAERKRLQAEINSAKTSRLSKSPKARNKVPAKDKEASSQAGQETSGPLAVPSQKQVTRIRAANWDEAERDHGGHDTFKRSGKHSASLSAPGSTKSVKSPNTEGLDHLAVNPGEGFDMHESATAVDDPSSPDIGAHADAPNSSFDSSFEEGLGEMLRDEQGPRSKRDELEFVNEEQMELPDIEATDAENVQIHDSSKERDGEPVTWTKKKAKAGAASQIEEYDDNTTTAYSPQGKHIIIRKAPSKKGPAAKTKKAKQRAMPDSEAPMKSTVQAWTPGGSPLSPGHVGSSDTGDPLSAAAGNPGEFGSATLDSPPSPIRGAFAAAVMAKKLGKKAKHQAKRKGSTVGTFQRKEQEVKEGDPAWHVAQIVSSSLHSVDPNFAPIVSNLNMENEQTLLGGWSPEGTRSLRGKLVSINEHGVKNCRMCENSRTMNIEDLSDAVRNMMNVASMPQSGEIDCPHCCGIMPQYRKAPFNINNNRWEQEKDDWNPPIYNPEPGEELEIYHINELMDRRKTKPTASPRDTGITALEINGEDMSFCVADAQGKVAELDLASGDITGRYLEKSGSTVHCLCLVGDFMYMGLDQGIQGVKLAPSPQESQHGRKFVGQKIVFCLAASPDQRLLISGSKDCTTWVWDLRTGRVLTYLPPVEALVPPPLRHLASETCVTRTRFSFAFRQHREAVSCVAAFGGGMVTGSWDGTVCVSFLTGYKDRVDDQVLAPLVDRHLAPTRKTLKDLKQDTEQQRAAADRETNRKKNKLLMQALRETEEQMAVVGEQVKALAHIEKIRLPRLKNLNGCRRFLHDSRARGRVLSVIHATIKSGAHVIFAAYSDGAVWQWDILTMAPTCVYLHYAAASLSSVTSDDVRLFTGYSDGTIKLWPIHQDPRGGGSDKPKCFFTSRNFATLVGHSDHIVRLSAMQNLLVSASLDETVRVWDMAACLDYVYASLQAEDADIADNVGDNLCTEPSLIGNEAPSRQLSQKELRDSAASPAMPQATKTRSHASSLSGGPRSLGIMSPGAFSFKLGRSGSQKSHDTAISFASGEGDLEPHFFTDPSYSQPVEPHADLLEMTSAVEQLADRLTTTSLRGQEVLSSNRALLHPVKPKTSVPKAK